VSTDQPALTGPDKLTRAFEHVCEILSHVGRLREVTLGLEQLDPSESDLREPLLSTLKTDIGKLVDLVLEGPKVLGPVESQLTRAAPDAVSACGAHGPNAHSAIVDLGNRVASKLLAASGMSLSTLKQEHFERKCGWVFFITGLHESELNRMLALAKREQVLARKVATDVGGVPGADDGTAHGVSLLDAALILTDEDKKLAPKKVQAWQRIRKPACPPSIGKSPEHKQKNLYEPSALCDYLEQVEDATVWKPRRLRERLKAKARRPRGE